MNLRKFASLCLFCLNLLCSLSLAAQVQKPKLIVGIVVEQINPDYITKYWDQLSENGFKRLLKSGFFAKNAFLPYYYTLAAPGYATISTGTLPSVHGIVANNWIDKMSSAFEQTRATYDVSVKTVGGSFESGLHSPKKLMVPTIGDHLKVNTFAQSKVYSVSLDPTAAVLSAGHKADAAYWFDCERAFWVSSTSYQKKLPKWLEEENQKENIQIYLSKTWETELPLEKYLSSLTDANPYETGLHKQKSFPYVLPEIAKSLPIAERNRLLHNTPFGNTFTTDLAISLVMNEKLGLDDFVDLLTVSYVANGNITNNFGALSVEAADAFLKLDRDLAHFFTFLDSWLDPQKTLIYLTSNHPAPPMNNYIHDLGLPLGQFASTSAVSLLNSYLSAIYGPEKFVFALLDEQIYLNRPLIEQKKLNFDEIQLQVADFLLQFSGVTAAISDVDLRRNSYNGGFQQLMQNGYFPKRSGDVFFHLNAGWISKTAPKTPYVGTYGQNNLVPLFISGCGIAPSTTSRQIPITSIAATIYNLLGYQPLVPAEEPIPEIIK